MFLYCGRKPTQAQGEHANSRQMVSRAGFEPATLLLLGQSAIHYTTVLNEHDCSWKHEIFFLFPIPCFPALLTPPLSIKRTCHTLVLLQRMFTFLVIGRKVIRNQKKWQKSERRKIWAKKHKKINGPVPRSSHSEANMHVSPHICKHHSNHTCEVLTHALEREQ